jgi:tubulin---tyrosine ligase
MTANSWIVKQPSSILGTHVKPSCNFELDYAEFLDEALVEAWELQESFRKNQDKDPADREWWIIKPGMSDRGQGIRLFSTEAELQSIFEQWEAERPDSDDEEEEQNGIREEVDATIAPLRNLDQDRNNDYIMTSQLRHFVAQPYIHPPLLLPSNPHKFHIRTYVLAVGSLKIYVYRPMLALFASVPYKPPWDSPTTSLLAHLTNTCLQDDSSSSSSSSSNIKSKNSRSNAVSAFWSLPSSIPSLATLPAGIQDWREHVFTQICEVTGEIFEAAARAQMVYFQTLPNAFEVFGVDFLVDSKGTAWLLEVNAFPDFKQTGEELRELIAGLWESVVDVAVAPFFSVQGMKRKDEEENIMVLVRDLDLGRR